MNQTTLIEIGMVVIFIGIIIIVISMFFPQKTSSSAVDKSKSSITIDKPKIAVVGFLGPVPFGFGNDQKWLKIALIIGFVLILIVWLLRFRV